MTSSSAHCDWTLADEVQQCTLRPWLMTSSGAHCDRTLADEVQPSAAVHTAIRNWRRGLARHLAKRIGEGEEEKKEEEKQTALIKSSNPHLAGGEQDIGVNKTLPRVKKRFKRNKQVEKHMQINERITRETN